MNATSVYQKLSRLRLESKGQDLVEYALMAAGIAVAAGAIFPSTIAPNISTIFSKVVSIMSWSPG